MKYQIIDGLKPYRISFKTLFNPKREYWIRYAKDMLTAETEAKEALQKQHPNDHHSFMIENLEMMGLTTD